MTTADYKKIEAYMLDCMQDSAHDREHVYRVLYTALEIAENEQTVDFDVLLAACLLHDIGRLAQNQNPALDHAEVGAQKAQAFLAGNGFPETFCARVADCIYTHRFRSSRPPETVEAKILFDADKLDATGAMGIARTLSYRSTVDEPLYTLCADGTVCDGTGDAPPSFFQEYKFKLERLYDRFYTKRGKALALERRAAAVSFYENLLSEVRAAQDGGEQRVQPHLSN